MHFQIHALPEFTFAPLFVLSDTELAVQNAIRIKAPPESGIPCRISLADAQEGETVILLNYQHQAGASPYQAAHAIYIREGATECRPEPCQVPAVLQSRLISVRVFDSDHMMIDADVVDGRNLADEIPAFFADRAAHYIHLHFAKPGCFAASVTRA